MALTRTDIRAMLARRMEQATLTELWDLDQRISANDAGPSSMAPIRVEPRFTKLDLRGYRLLDSADNWLAVYDAETDLTWTRDVLECGDQNWKDSMTAARNLRLFGKEDWRAPTVKEQISIIDYARCKPAVDTTYFSSYAGYCWTSTVDAEYPSDYAWIVSLRYGRVGRFDQADHGSVRAVRAGQPLELGL